MLRLAGPRAVSPAAGSVPGKLAAAEAIRDGWFHTGDLARAVFRRAIERGEIPADTNIEVALDLIYGPLYHRLLQGHAPLDDRFVRDAVDMALNGIRANMGP